MLKLGRARGAIPRLRHEQVVESFVDYHFGRLSPEMNTAIERHVRSCPRCKREGLTNAANERRGAVRQLRSVRGGKPLIGKRGRRWILLLTLILATQVVIYLIANGRASALLSSLSHGSGAQIDGSQTSTVALTPSGAFPLITGGAAAIALSPDDKRLAVSWGSGQHHVALWDIASQKIIRTMPWSDATAPTTIAWSADGSRLAAADSTQIIVWDTSSGAVIWQFGIPSAPAMRVYDVSQQVIVSRPDPARAFTGGALAWGADGALSSAPVGALGPIGVSTPQSPVIGMWSSAGSHIFASGDGAALVGASQTDDQRGVTLLDWAPGGRYLLWGALSQPIALDGAHTAPSDSQPPDSVVGQLASTIAKAGASANALVWFGPQGKRLALCDLSASGAHIQIIDIATGHASYQLGDSCAGLSAHSAAWSSTGSVFYVVPAKGPIETYSLSSSSAP